MLMNMSGPAVMGSPELAWKAENRPF